MYYTQLPFEIKKTQQNKLHILIVGELGSSVSVVSGYGLDDRAIEFRSTADAKGFLK
jgi:hypothetical protein